MMLIGYQHTLTLANHEIQSNEGIIICKHLIYFSFDAFLLPSTALEAAFVHFKHPLCIFQGITQGSEANPGLLKEIKADYSKGEVNGLHWTTRYRANYRELGETGLPPHNKQEKVRVIRRDQCDWEQVCLMSNQWAMNTDIGHVIIQVMCSVVHY